MIAFSEVKGITIPEGSVVRISWGNVALWEKNTLPKEYQAVEWIGVSGTQWINTGISPQSDHVVYECEWVETSLERYAVVFGSTNPSYVTNRNRWSASHYHPVTGTLYSATGVTDQLCKLTSIITAGEKNTLKTTIKDGSITLALNGQSATAAYSGTIQNGVNIGLFANNQSTKVAEYAKYTRMYCWKMWDSGVMVRNMIPCYRKVDGVIGMYDTVSSQFFTNAGTGEFTCGGTIKASDDGKGNITWESPEVSVSHDGAGNVTIGSNVIKATDDGAGNVAVSIGG